MGRRKQSKNINYLSYIKLLLMLRPTPLSFLFSNSKADILLLHVCACGCVFHRSSLPLTWKTNLTGGENLGNLASTPSIMNLLIRSDHLCFLLSFLNCKQKGCMQTNVNIYLFSFEDTFIDFFREEGGESNTSMWERNMDWLPPACAPT